MKANGLVHFLVVLAAVSLGNCFIPYKFIQSIVQKIDASSRVLDFGKVSRSFSHEEIMRRGVIRLVAKYFFDQPGGQTKVKLNNMERYFNDIDNLYRDYYGRASLYIKFKHVIVDQLEAQVGIVDLDPKTAKLPYVHFDAERLVQSNNRVIEFKNRIFQALNSGNYKEARDLTGQILHTIHDFYSHSNWVEMGRKTINSDIGSASFNSQPIVETRDSNLCRSNCELVEIKCSLTLNAISSILEDLDPDTTFACPIRYYKCNGNIRELNELLSGYYTDQKLEDGTKVENAGNLAKCNHGGVLDSNSYERQALGGINKDSGVYLISPHANLHLEAANLAELHTEEFFNSIRKRIGDKNFSEFLELETRFL